MRKTSVYLTAAALGFSSLIGCGGSSSSGSAGSRLGTQSQTVATSASPAPFGPTTQNLGPIPLRYPANAGVAASSLVSVQTAAQRVGVGALNSPLKIQSATLIPWSATQAYQSGFRLFTIDPNRQVYQVATTFSTPLSVKENTWSSGTRVFVVDAATGDVIWSITRGNQTASHADMVHKFKMPPPTGGAVH